MNVAFERIRAEACGQDRAIAAYPGLNPNSNSVLAWPNPGRFLLEEDG